MQKKDRQDTVFAMQITASAHINNKTETTDVEQPNNGVEPMEVDPPQNQEEPIELDPPPTALTWHYTTMHGLP